MTKDYSIPLTSRFCHDLANPLGAISNGLELLLLSGMDHTPEMSLLEESITQAHTVLKRFRLGFGAINPDTKASRHHTDHLTSVWNDACRVPVSATQGVDINGPQGKLICLLLFCAESALPMKGALILENGENTLEIHGTGRRIKWDQELWNHVTGGPQPWDDPTATHLHFPMAGTFALKLGYRITTQHNDEGFQISVTL